MFLTSIYATLNLHSIQSIPTTSPGGFVDLYKGREYCITMAETLTEHFMKVLIKMFNVLIKEIFTCQRTAEKEKSRRT